MHCQMSHVKQTKNTEPQVYMQQQQHRCTCSNSSTGVHAAHYVCRLDHTKSINGKTCILPTIRATSERCRFFRRFGSLRYASPRQGCGHGSEFPNQRHLQIAWCRFPVEVLDRIEQRTEVVANRSMVRTTRKSVNISSKSSATNQLEMNKVSGFCFWSIRIHQSSKTSQFALAWLCSLHQ